MTCRSFVLETVGVVVLGPLLCGSIGSLSFGDEKAPLATTPLPDGPPGKVCVLEGHVGVTYSVAFLPDGRQIVSSGSGGTFLWDVGSQKRIWKARPVGPMAVSPQGRTIAVAWRSVMHLIDRRDGRITRQLEPKASGAIRAIAYSPDGKWIAAAGNGKKILLWETSRGEFVRELTGHPRSVYALVFSPDSRTLISGGMGRVIQFQSVDSGEEVREPIRAGIDLWSVARSRDGRSLVVAGRNRSAILWDLTRGIEVRRFNEHTSFIHRAVFTPDGSRIVSGSDDKTVRCWDTKTGRELARFEGHRCNVLDVAVSPDGRFAASVAGGVRINGKWSPGDDFAVRIWRLPKAESSPSLDDRRRTDAPDSTDFAVTAVRVKFRKPAAYDNSWLDMPDWMNGAVIFSQLDHSQPRGKGVSGREVLFDVLKPTTVFVLASWSYDGNRTGGWYETRSSLDDLKRQGWTPIGKVRRRKKDGSIDDYVVLRQDVPAGRSFRFHTRKYNPPYVALVPPDRLSTVPDHDPTLATSCLLPPWPRKIARWDAGKAGTDTVVLTARDPDLKEPTDSWGMLQRELVRQAILLAARDELGLSTRDPMLREIGLNDSGDTAPLEVIVTVTSDRTLKITLFRAAQAGWQVLWDRQIALPGDGLLLEHVLEQAEKLSRSEFPAMLQEAGFPKKAVPPPSDAPLDDNTRKLMRIFQIVAQFGMVRQLHRQIREQGESPARLEGLARGYVHLGVLAEPFWSPAQKVFKARALLYARRAIRKSPQSSSVYLTQAYVWLLCGFHRAASQSLERSMRLAEERTVDKKAPEKSPTERDVLAAAAHSDFKKLAEWEANDRVRSLVRLLLFQAYEPTRQRFLPSRYSKALLEEYPYSFRPLAWLMHHPKMGPRGEAIRESFLRFPASLYNSLELVTDFPSELLDVVKREAPRFKEEFDTAEFELRARLIRSLTDAGEPRKDDGEPSLTVLGQLVLDVGLVQAVARLDMGKRTLGVPVDDTILEFRPLVAGHPDAAYIETYASDPVRINNALGELAKTINRAAVGEPERRWIDMTYYHLSSGKYRDLIRHVNRHLDPCLRELYERIRALNDDRQSKQIRTQVRQLQQVCPEHPLTAALTIRYDWERAEPRLAEWEERFSDHPLVLYQLALQYEKHKNHQAAERCLKHVLKVAPNSASYRWLADFYYRRGEFETWQKTLDEMLQRTEPEGLEHASAQSQIARHLMQRQEFDKALPYAEAAAQSYSGWSLMCLATCLENLGRLDESEKLLRASAERYASGGVTWLAWCVRHGRGDRETARRLSLRYINNFPQKKSNSQVHTLAFYSFLIGDQKQAQTYYEESWKREKNPATGAIAAILADELKQPELRNRLLLAVVDYQKQLPADSQWQCLCNLLNLILDGVKKNHIDVERADQMIAKGPSTMRATCNYVLARFLHLHGQPDTARVRMIDAATSPWIESFRDLAMIWLRKNNIPFGKPRPPEPAKS